MRGNASDKPRACPFIPLPRPSPLGEKVTSGNRSRHSRMLRKTANLRSQCAAISFTISPPSIRKG
ncbi:hypothetical protein D3C71_622270 [compost metagenome]